jgi:hypothetical protein
MVESGKLHGKDATWKERRPGFVDLNMAIIVKDDNVRIFDETEEKRAALSIASSPAFQKSIYSELLVCLRENPRGFEKLLEERGPLGKDALDDLMGDRWRLIVISSSLYVGEEFEFEMNPILIKHHLLTNFGMMVADALIKARDATPLGILGRLVRGSSAAIATRA